jgi:sugar O-acyltransferase (sialic acid O-acetyltransferase NeuD family)
MVIQLKLNNMKKIVIAATGGFAKEILTILHDLGKMHLFDGFINPDNFFKKEHDIEKIIGFPILNSSQVKPETHDIIIGIGNPLFREKVYKELGDEFNYPNVIHPSAIISQWVTIGKGAVICPGVIITCGITIGDFCQLNLSTTVGHDCVMGDYFTTAPGAHISGNCIFGKGVYFGTSSAVRQGINICDNVTIGMGGIVVKNITETGVYVGNPVKQLIKK